MNIPFGEFLKELRLRNAVTDIPGIPLLDIEAGRISPTLDHLESIAQAFNLHAADLLALAGYTAFRREKPQDNPGSVIITVRVNAEEEAAYTYAAQTEGFASRSEWIRSVLSGHVGKNQHVILKTPPAKRNGTFPRYDVAAIRSRINETRRAIKNAKTEETRKSREKELGILERALVKIETPGRHVLNGPQREAVRFARLYGKKDAEE
jgi:transcriptional regulator with XRE-family HTH domain